MAGRGGRGRGGKGRGFTFDIGAIGFGRGSDALPAAILQPPPLFPPLERRPLPLRMSEKDDYMLVLKEEFKLIMNTSPYYVKPDAAKKDIERYSDRFKEKQQTDPSNSWTPDWDHFPDELKIKPKTSKSHGKKSVKPNTKNASRKRKLDTSVPDIDFDTLEKEDEKEKETEAGSKPTQETKTTEGKAESDDEIDEEDYDEEEQEEENDYLVSHFDDDDDLGEDDDMDEGPIY